MIGKKMMAESKFFMGYSRWLEEESRYETWEEAVERVMNMHREKYAHVMTDELEQLIAFAEEAYKEKRVLGAQRALQFGGEQIFKHVARMYNCFHEDEEFITNQGVVSFKDFSKGDKVSVLTHTGKWQDAVVNSYGEQTFNKVTLSYRGVDKEVTVTPNHRWLLKNGRETTNLKVGDLLYKPTNTFGEFDYYKATPEERLYWCYGLVYGDGTRVKDRNGVHKHSMIRLCGTDKQFADRFEEVGFKTSTNDSLDGDFFAYTGTYLKTAPDPEVDSPNLIRAFVSGYLQADGTKSRSSHGSQYVRIQSSEEDHINFIRECFPIAGVWILGETDLTGQETNYGVRGKTVMFSVNDNMSSKYNPGWKVRKIEENVSNDIAWCLEVEEDKSFLMPNGIVTGNCVSTHINRPEAFQETMYLLLCGCGVGFSVQRHHTEQLPNIRKRYDKKSKVFTVPDTIEGWADAFGVLLSSYFEEDGTFPEYRGCQVHFDFTKIRPKGAEISGGFKAPGPDGLRQALQKCEDLLTEEIENGETKIRPIVAYDFIMHMADAVLSGGVRRSATICMFSKDDEDMLNAKTGNWFIDNPQRGRSNNSVMLLRDELTREEWAHIMESVKQVGEPGFIFTDNLEFTFNPCVEIGKLPVTEDGESGFQACNLCEISGSQCNTVEEFLRACQAASIIGTLQAGYTDFKYLSEASQKIVEREALIGVSITGWMNNPEVLFDEQNMKQGAQEVNYWNKKVAEMVGINQAARTCCVKPSGNASVLLGTASGIHGEHSPMYFRNVQMNDQDDVLHSIATLNPKMVEDSVWSSTGTDKVVSFPVYSQEGSIYKSNLLGVKQLEFVKKAQQFWVEHGTNVDLCTDPRLRHNVSNTITVDDWDEVEEYIFHNRNWFAGISLLSAFGDKAYPQAPFTEVFTAQQILDKYGDASMFASGLIIDGLHAFHGNLWTACDTVNGWGMQLNSEDSEHLLKRDWVRRARKYASNYFSGDILEMTNCLKDCYNLHKWKTVERTIKPIDFTEELGRKQFIEVDTMGAASCAGGSCEVNF